MRDAQYIFKNARVPPPAIINLGLEKSIKSRRGLKEEEFISNVILKQMYSRTLFQEQSGPFSSA